MPISESNRPRVGLVCVGSELLRGKLNTHASTVALRLASIGLSFTEEHTLPDDQDALTRTIRSVLARTNVVLLTGGLGPTFDDITREAAAKATGHPLVFSKALFQGITAKFRRVHYKMPPANARQAYLLRGAEPINNPVGTAPGQWLDVSAGERKVVILLPGPPNELHPMLEQTVLPKLKRTFPPRPMAEAHLHFAGVPESLVDQRVRPLITQAEARFGTDVQFTILAKLGLVDLDIFVAGRSVRAASQAIEALVKQVRGTMGDRFYGRDAEFPLEKVVQDHFLKKRMTLALAESCTGGLLAARLTEIAGSSDYFLGGVVSYSNALKEAGLGVPATILRAHGAVSKATAIAMAEGVRQRTGATIGLSITGIAGPGGGTPTKPVGTVHIAIAGPKETKNYEFHFKGSRESVRQRAVVAALDFLRFS